MVTDPHEIILNHLRAIRSDMSKLQDGLKDLKTGQIAVREDLHAVRGDFLRQEKALAAVEIDIDRINVRLGISDQPTQ